MIRVLMGAEQAKAGDRIQVAGLTYQIRSVVHGELGVQIEAARLDDTGTLVLLIHPEAPFEIIAPDQDGRS